MKGKVFGGLIVVFWATMMSLLVRTEFLPSSPQTSTVPNEQVLKRFFSNFDATRLDVFYGGKKVGFCTIDIDPLASVDGGTVVAGHAPQAYQISSALKVTYSLFGTPTRILFTLDGVLNHDYEVERFDLHSTIGDGHMNAVGDKRTGKVTADIDVGGLKEQHEFPFTSLEGGLTNASAASVASRFGLPEGTLPMVSNNPTRVTPVTTVRMDNLKIGSAEIPTYLVETRSEKQTWAKVWMDERGEVLLVITSLGLSMRADVLGSETAVASDDQRVAQDTTGKGN